MAPAPLREVDAGVALPLCERDAMTTPARRHPLSWFSDHARDVNAVMGRQAPTARMRKLMIREGQVKRVPTALRNLRAHELTDAGHALRSAGRRKKGGRDADQIGAPGGRAVSDDVGG